MKKLGILMIPLLILSLIAGAFGCGDGESWGATPEPVSDSKIPAHFSTYTEEGLFRISYPPDWAPATAFMGEVWEETKRQMEGTIEDVYLEDMQMLFLAGMPTDEGYHPSVTIVVTSREPGYWTLDEVVAAEDAFAQANTPGYQVYSRTNATVAGIEAAIDDSTDNEPGYGQWRYITMMLVKDEFVWGVICGSMYDDFRYHEDDFYSIVKSLRILQ
ncbi:hypothetical protein ACFLXV_00110 [Chloroflexota bacterium]